MPRKVRDFVRGNNLATHKEDRIFEGGHIMAKRRYGMKESVHMERNERPKSTDARSGSYMGRDGKHRAMQPNMPGASFIEEDWSEPALLKRGVHEFDVTYHANKHRSGRIGDLYKHVDETTKADQAAFDKLTDPHNW